MSPDPPPLRLSAARPPTGAQRRPIPSWRQGSAFPSPSQAAIERERFAGPDKRIGQSQVVVELGTTARAYLSSVAEVRVRFSMLVNSPV